MFAGNGPGTNPFANPAIGNNNKSIKKNIKKKRGAAGGMESSGMNDSNRNEERKARFDAVHSENRYLEVLNDCLSSDESFKTCIDQEVYPRRKIGRP